MIRQGNRFLLNLITNPLFFLYYEKKIFKCSYRFSSLRINALNFLYRKFRVDQQASCMEQDNQQQVC